jgi:hypothetical protein
MTLTLWIPGRWKSPNAFSGFLPTKHKQVVTAREKAGLYLHKTLVEQKLPGKWKGPVRITFAGLRKNKLDSGDNLNSSFKAYRDELIAKLGLKSDSDASGNQFVYPPLEKPARGAEEGVSVTIDTLCRQRCGRLSYEDGGLCAECRP